MYVLTRVYTLYQDAKGTLYIRHSYETLLQLKTPSSKSEAVTISLKN